MPLISRAPGARSARLARSARSARRPSVVSRFSAPVGFSPGAASASGASNSGTSNAFRYGFMLFKAPLIIRICSRFDHISNTLESRFQHSDRSIIRTCLRAIYSLLGGLPERDAVCPLVPNPAMV